MRTHKMMRRILLGATFLFFYFPILYMLVFSFNDSRSLTHFDGFSLQWYDKMFHDAGMLEAIYYTLVTAIIATIVATFIGTLTAIGLSKSRRIIREVVSQINNLPIMNPEIVTAVGMMLFYVSIHMDNVAGTYCILYTLCDFKRDAKTAFFG